ncbi:MAG TPA: hypothetical protein DCQ33_13665 [Nitrospira sp.]|nr:hypothetical protein [Nitrospira sp.]
MLRETGVVAITGVKRFVQLAVGIALVLVALACAAFVCYKAFGLLVGAGLLASGTAKATASTGASISFSIAVMAFFGFLAYHSWRESLAWLADASAPVAEDFKTAAQAISSMETATKGLAAGAKAAIEKARDINTKGD